ncbi:MAG: hypothetical protein ACXV7H_12655 [Methylobacter sp.]
MAFFERWRQTTRIKYPAILPNYHKKRLFQVFLILNQACRRIRIATRRSQPHTAAVFSNNNKKKNMNQKILVFIAVSCIGLSACSGKKDNQYQVKTAFINSCIKQESSARSVEQATSYCNCAADAVFSNSNISDETKNLMPTISDKSGKIHQQNDISTVKGLLMACYTKKFYKK